MQDGKENPAPSTRRASWETPALTKEFFPHTLAYNEQILAKHRLPAATRALEQDVEREFIVIGTLIKTGFEYGIFDPQRKPLLHTALEQGLNLDRLRADKRGRTSAIIEDFKTASTKDFLVACDGDTNPFVKIAHDFGFRSSQLWSAYPAPTKDPGNKWHGAFAQIAETLATDLQMVGPIEIQKLFFSLDCKGQARVMAGLVEDLIETNLTIIIARHLGMISATEELSMLTNKNFPERQREAESLCCIFRSLIHSWNDAELMGLLDPQRRLALERATWAKKDIISINRGLEELEGMLDLSHDLSDPNLPLNQQFIQAGLRMLDQRLNDICKNSGANSMFLSTTDSDHSQKN